MAGRKDNGDGSITKRADSRWEARVTLPDGKRKSFYGKTKEEVKKKLEQAKRDIHAGLPVISNNQTVSQFLEEWILTMRPHLRLGTWKNYKGYIYNHIIPSLGMTHLTKLTAHQVELFLAEKMNNGLSSTTAGHIYRMLHHSIKDALRLGLVQRNVLDMVKEPRVAHRQMVTLSEIQVSQLLLGMADDRLAALYVLAVTTGMREGELLGLRWCDVDTENGTLVVHQALHNVAGKLFIAETKTTYSRRRIALTHLAIDALQQHRVKQEQEHEVLGAIWDDTLDLVFSNPIGKMLSPTWLTYNHFQQRLKRLGLPHMRFHDLRHTCATLLLSRGVNVKVVSEMLGHSDIAITLRVYGHVLPHMQESAIREMDAIFSESHKLSSKLSSKQP